jgi:hypothetical protein
MPQRVPSRLVACTQARSMVHTSVDRYAHKEHSAPLGGKLPLCGLRAMSAGAESAARRARAMSAVQNGPSPTDRANQCPAAAVEAR